MPGNLYIIFNPIYTLGNRSERRKCATGLVFNRIEHRNQSNPFGEAHKERKSHEWCAVAAHSRFVNEYFGFILFLLFVFKIYFA